MICPFCNNSVNDTIDNCVILTVSCHNHKPIKVKVTRHWSTSEVIEASATFIWDDEVDLLVTWNYSGKMYFEFVRVVEGWMDYEEIAVLNKILPGVTLNNAKEYAQRFINMRAFS